MTSVDVIIPCYRYAHFLRECVESVLAQTGPSVRALIIDDASPDHTHEVATALCREDSRVLGIRHAANKGHIATYNEGLEWATADYVLLLSADDYLLPGALGRATALMDGNSDVGFVFGNAIRFDSDGTRTPIESVKNKTEIISGLSFMELSGPGNIVPTPTAVVRTELQRKVGGYRAELPHSGDMEMWLRLAAHGSVGLVASYQAVYRRHVGNMSLNYMMDVGYPDIEQRKAALDCFFHGYAHLLPNANLLQRKFYRILGCNALGLASSAFDDGRLKMSGQLRELAFRICPQVWWSFSFAKLLSRRCVGYRLWHAMQVTLRSLRSHLVQRVQRSSATTGDSDESSVPAIDRVANGLQCSAEDGCSNDNSQNAIVVPIDEL